MRLNEIVFVSLVFNGIVSGDEKATSRSPLGMMPRMEPMRFDSLDNNKQNRDPFYGEAVQRLPFGPPTDQRAFAAMQPRPFPQSERVVMEQPQPQHPPRPLLQTPRPILGLMKAEDMQHDDEKRRGERLLKALADARQGQEQILQGHEITSIKPEEDKNEAANRIKAEDDQMQDIIDKAMQEPNNEITLTTTTTPNPIGHRSVVQHHKDFLGDLMKILKDKEDVYKVNKTSKDVVKARMADELKANSEIDSELLRKLLEARANDNKSRLINWKIVNHGKQTIIIL